MRRNKKSMRGASANSRRMTRRTSAQAATRSPIDKSGGLEAATEISLPPHYSVRLVATVKPRGNEKHKT
jgi:hypothetical protein